MIAAAAVLQWAIVLERVWAAAWAWYKFVDYGGGGHIVVGRMPQIVFLIGSIALAGIGHALSKAESGAGGSVFWRRLAQVAWSAVSICAMVWIALLLSPLVTFQAGLTPLTH
jgi:hypothetical protein